MRFALDRSTSTTSISPAAAMPSSPTSSHEGGLAYRILAPHRDPAVADAVIIIAERSSAESERAGIPVVIIVAVFPSRGKGHATASK